MPKAKMHRVCYWGDDRRVGTSRTFASLEQAEAFAEKEVEGCRKMGMTCAITIEEKIGEEKERSIFWMPVKRY